MPHRPGATIADRRHAASAAFGARDQSLASALRQFALRPSRTLATLGNDVRSQPLTAYPLAYQRSLAYLSWRERAAAVQRAYERWARAGTEETADAYARYRALLDEEEHASLLYAALLLLRA